MFPYPFRQIIELFTRSVPFSPFAIELTNGEILIIDHPESVRLENGLVNYTLASGIVHFFDAASVFRVMAMGSAAEFKSYGIPSPRLNGK